MEPVATQRQPVVLVVDDQADHSFLVRKALLAQEPQPQVIEASSGKEALRLLEESPVDLVLLDLNMPGMSGQEVLGAIRAHPTRATTPVTILSTSDRREDVTGCFALHANAYLRKPPSFRELRDAMAVVTEHWFSTTILPTSRD